MVGHSISSWLYLAGKRHKYTPSSEAIASLPNVMHERGTYALAQ